jgi:hypothetical protein
MMDAVQDNLYASPLKELPTGVNMGSEFHPHHTATHHGNAQRIQLYKGRLWGAAALR